MNTENNVSIKDVVKTQQFHQDYHPSLQVELLDLGNSNLAQTLSMTIPQKGQGQRSRSKVKVK